MLDTQILKNDLENIFNKNFDFEYYQTKKKLIFDFDTNLISFLGKNDQLSSFDKRKNYQFFELPEDYDSTKEFIYKEIVECYSYKEYISQGLDINLDKFSKEDFDVKSCFAKDGYDTNILEYLNNSDSKFRNYLESNENWNHNSNIEYKVQIDEQNKILLARESNDFSILESLSKDPDELIRLRVANNHNTPSYILESFRNDPDEMVRYALIGNPNTPQNIIKEINDIEESYVGYAERTILEYEEKKFEKNDLKVLSELDKELKIVENGLSSNLSKLAKDTTSPHTLDAIYKKSFSIENYYDNLYIKSSIYSNPNISNELITKVSDLYLKNGFDYQNDYSLEKLIQNPSLSSEQVQLLNKLYQKEKDYFEQEENSRDKANALAGDMDYLAAKFEKTNDKQIDYEYEMTFDLASKSRDINVLEELSKSEYGSIRAEVIKNPNSSKEIIEKLAQDEDLEVSGKAMDKLATFDHNLKDTINEVSNYNLDESTNSNKNNYKHR